MTKISLILTLLFFQVKPLFSQCNTIEKIQEYKKKVKIINSKKMNDDRIDTSTFNLNTYMKLYPALKKEPAGKRMVFDYYYYDFFLGGRPCIYIKDRTFNLIEHINQKADKIALMGGQRHDFIQSSLYYFLSDSCNKVANCVFPEDTEEGYVQYLYFCEFGELFALKWHESYKHKEVVCTKEKVEEIVKKYTEEYIHACLTEEISEDGETAGPSFECDTIALQSLLSLESVFSIQFNEDVVIIKWLEVGWWRGIFERTYQIMRQSPYRIELLDEKKLVSFSHNFIF